MSYFLFCHIYKYLNQNNLLVVVVEEDLLVFYFQVTIYLTLGRCDKNRGGILLTAHSLVCTQKAFYITQDGDIHSWLDPSTWINNQQSLSHACPQASLIDMTFQLKIFLSRLLKLTIKFNQETDEIGTKIFQERPFFGVVNIPWTQLNNHFSHCFCVHQSTKDEVTFSLSWWWLIILQEYWGRSLPAKLENTPKGDCHFRTFCLPGPTSLESMLMSDIFSFLSLSTCQRPVLQS